MHESSYGLTGLNLGAVPKVSAQVRKLPEVSSVSFNWIVYPPAMNVQSTSRLGHEAITAVLQGTGVRLQMEQQ